MSSENGTITKDDAVEAILEERKSREENAMKEISAILEKNSCTLVPRVVIEGERVIASTSVVARD